MHAQVPNHEPSLMLMNCGDSVQPRPSVGAWVMYGLGTENQNLPGFVAMCPDGLPIKDSPRTGSRRFLPGVYQGTYIDPQHEQLDKLIENIRSPHASLGHAAAAARSAAAAEPASTSERRSTRGWTLASSRSSWPFACRCEAADAFDVAHEPQHILDLYGPGVHGRQTLIARRLLERGVRYVQLWHGAGQPWDNHAQIEANHRKLAGRARSADRRLADGPQAARDARRHARSCGAASSAARRRSS